MFIDATDELTLKKAEQLKQKLIEHKKYDDYTAEDIALVRVTDHFPIDGIINSISNVPFVHYMNDLSHEALDEILKEEGLSYDERKEEVNSHTPLSTQYRSSVHFCLNGIVSSHAYGNFDGNPFVIIEPFKHHESNPNILSVRGEDTYFQDRLTLSQDAIILVDERFKDLVPNNSNLNIIFYRGDQSKAVEIALLSMEIIPEVVGKDYIIESDTSEKIRTFIRGKKYPCDKHCFSESYKYDDEQNLKLWDIYSKEFYKYLYTRVYGDITNYQDEIKYLVDANSFNEEAKAILKNIIRKLGIKEYEKLVDEYNELIRKKISEGKYPTNNEILSGKPLDYIDYDKLKTKTS